MPTTERPIADSTYNAGVSDALASKAPLSHVGAGGAEHPEATDSTDGFMSAADKSKLDGVASGATANSTDATLLARANHTGTQAASTISDLNSAVRATALSGLTFPAATAVTTADTVLSGMGKLQSQVTAALSGSTYRGVWDASANSPTITAGTGTTGDFYVVSVAGTQSVTGSSVAFTVGDTVKFNGSAWQRIPSYAAVSSVAGRTGAVTLTSSDVGLGNVDNTSDANKPISTAQQAALDAKAPLSHVGVGGSAHAAATTGAAGFMAPSDKTLLGTALQPGSFGLGQPYASGTSPLLADLDDVTVASGMYRATNTTAGTFPNGAVACFVFVERYSGSWVKQTLTYRGDKAQYGLTYVRTYNGSGSPAAWRPWQRVVYAESLATDIIAAATDLTAS